MHARSVLQKLLTRVLSKLDHRNACNLLTSVEACIVGRRLVLMDLARHWPGAMRVAAPLKRIDRLLSNPAVQAHRTAFYGAAAAVLISTQEPIVVVDWSELKSDGRWHLLRAGLAVRGRTLTVYEEVHPQRSLGARRVQVAFLNRLCALLPADSRPIIVTDAGFKVPWFRAVEALGWHWLGRVRGQVMMCPCDPAFAPFQRVQSYYGQAQDQARSLGRFLLAQSQALACNVVLIRQPRRGRKQRNRRTPTPASGGHPQKMARSAAEPWLLACSESLGNRCAAQIVRYYALRMQIECSFRDLKSHRYGCAFEDTLTRTAERLQMLLMIHMLAAAQWEMRFRVSLMRRGWDLLRLRQARLDGDPVHRCRRLSELIRLAAETP